MHERDVGAELTVDHFQPRSKGGGHALDNWVYCCHACNEFKSDHWQSDGTCRILHPLRDDLALHLTEEQDGNLRGLSETGAFHIDRLHLSRAPLVEARRERQRARMLREAEAIELEKLGKLLERLRVIISKITNTNDKNPP